MNATDKQRHTDDGVSLATNEVYTYSREEVRKINTIMEVFGCDVNKAITLMRKDFQFATPNGTIKTLPMDRYALRSRISSIQKVKLEDEMLTILEREEVLQEEQRTKGVL
jgi:hypothetical protein